MAFCSFHSFNRISHKPKKVSTGTTSFQTLLVNKPPWGRYSASSWSGTTLTDLTTNGRNATTSGVSSGTASGNGSTASIAFLSGSTSNTIIWPAGSIPSTFTIASLTRYATSGTKRRILCGDTVNFIQGQYNGGRGEAFYGNGFYQGNTIGTALNWVGMVGTNSMSVAAPNNVLVDGVALASTNGGLGGGALTINYSTAVPGETSDFQFSQLIIWDQALTAAEMVTVATALNTYLSTGTMA